MGPGVHTDLSCIEQRPREGSPNRLADRGALGASRSMDREVSFSAFSDTTEDRRSSSHEARTPK